MAFEPQLRIPPAFVLPQWEPDHESSERYQARVAAQAKKLAREHVACIEEQLEVAAGWRRAKPLLARGARRWQWLAKYQICQMTYEDVAEGAVEASTVRRAVALAAERISLPLR